MEARSLSPYRWVILLVSCLVIFVADYMQYQLAALAYVIMPDLNIDVAQFSALLLGPILAGVFASIPGGSLADRFGSKGVVTVAVVISLLGAFGRLIASDFVTMLVMMVVIGVAPAVLQAASIKFYGSWFEDKMDFAMGVYFAAACAGIALGLATSTLFPSVQMAYLFSSIAFAVVLVLWVVLFRNVPKGTPLPPAEPVLKYFGVAARSRGVWLIAIAAGLGMATATNYSGILPQALIDMRDVDPMMAGNMAALLSIMSIAGSILGPIWSNRSGKTKLVVILISVIGGVVMIANWYTPIGVAFWILLLVNGIFSAASGPIINAMPFQLPEIGIKYAASAGGLVGSISLIISYFLPIGIGMVAGTDYSLNFVLEGVFFALAAIPIIFIPKLGQGEPGEGEQE